MDAQAILSKYDLTKYDLTKEAIRSLLPQRFEFEMLDAVIKCDIENEIIIGYREVKKDEFWIRGHVPGNPIFPGILMLETCAQLCTILYKQSVKEIRDHFIGFGAVDGVKFRGVVRPGDKMYLVGKSLSRSQRGCKCKTWIIVDGKIMFEAEILGVPISK